MSSSGFGNPWSYNSEPEDVAAGGIEEPPLEVSYWYGQLLMQYDTAKIVVQTRSLTDTTSTLDDKTREILSSFPYSAELDIVRSTLNFPQMSWIEAQCGTDRQAYITMLGTSSQTSNTHDYDRLHARLLNRLQNLASSGNDPRAESPSTESDSTSREDTSPRPSERRLNNALKALKESGDQDGDYPEYRPPTSLSSEPSLFRAVLVFKRRLYQAEGRTKKMATRIAALQACDANAIRVI